MILQEVYKRRGTESEFGIECIGDAYIVRFIMPLAELQDLSKNIRIITSGHASIHMELGGYQDISMEKWKGISNLARTRKR